MFDLEHGDFIKSKKAVTTAALAVIVSFRLKLAENDISIGNLKVEVSDGEIKKAAGFAFIYFAVIFVLHYSIKYRSDLVNLEASRNKLDQAIGNSDQQTIASEKTKRDVFVGRYRLSFLVDLFIPAVASAFAALTIIHYITL